VNGIGVIMYQMITHLGNVELVKRRFSDSENMSAFDELRKLYQTHTVKEYMQRFE
jgi:hypothetical protein